MMLQNELIVLTRDEEEEPSRALLLLTLRKTIEVAQNNAASAARPQTLADHLAAVSDMASTVVTRLGPLLWGAREATQIANAVVLAAQWHDRGKARDAWQADIGNTRPTHTDE